jgi:hypothetical protein
MIYNVALDIFMLYNQLALELVKGGSRMNFCQLELVETQGSLLSSAYTVTYDFVTCTCAASSKLQPCSDHLHRIFFYLALIMLASLAKRSVSKVALSGARRTISVQVAHMQRCDSYPNGVFFRVSSTDHQKLRKQEISRFNNTQG